MVFDTWNRKKRMNRKQEWLHFFSICIIIIIYYQGKLIMEKNIFKKKKKKKKGGWRSTLKKVRFGLGLSHAGPAQILNLNWNEQYLSLWCETERERGCRVLERKEGAVGSDSLREMASSSSRWRAVFGGTTTLMSAAKAKAKTTTTTTTTTTKTRSNIGIQKVLQISPQLGKFLDGATESSRTHAVKKVWEHIKLHHLQVSPSPFSIII